MTITEATGEDLQEILDLQYLAYKSEAALLNNPDIPPLKQTLTEIRTEYEKGMILKALDDDNTIIGSIRAYSENGTLHIGKLIVHPDRQGRKTGTRLLAELERIWPHQRYELFTSSQSLRNIKLYEETGYAISRKEQITETLTLIYLQKRV